MRDMTLSGDAISARARAWLAALLIAAIASISTGAVAQQRNLNVAPVQLNVPGERPVQLYGESYALVIGASNYTSGWPKLPGVLTDVRAVGGALREQGFRVTEVLNPTYTQLDGALRKFISDFGQVPGNRLLVYYAGHGHTLTSADGRQLGYIVPVDAPSDKNVGAFKAAALSMETIESYAKQIDAKHALFVFDSCFSGTFFKMRAIPENISVKTAQPVRQFITAGSADQAVPDVSVFRQQFLAGVKGEADLNRDGYVTGSELGMFLEEKVTNYSRGTQTPQYGKIRDPNLDKGDFVFALPSLKPAPNTAVVSTPAGDPAAMEIALWESVKDSRSADELQAYLDQYPNGKFAAVARARLKTLQSTQVAIVQPTTIAQPKPPVTAITGAQAGSTFRDCSDCPEMVWVPAGSFTMGSPGDEPGRDAAEGPQHRVNITRNFAAGRFHVTRRQFAAFVRETSYNAGDKCFVRTAEKFEEQSGKGWRDPGFAQTDNDPVVCVNWDDAKAYAAWLARKTGKSYRLLTEAEWEYAARAGTSGRRYWGENDSESCRYANVADASAKSAYNLTYTTFSCNDGYAATSPAGKFEPNSFGLYDMLGNAWQWTEDCWNANYNGAPGEGGAWTSGTCGQRVLRGGSWNLAPRRMRVAYRGGVIAGNRSSGRGFRIARTE